MAQGEGETNLVQTNNTAVVSSTVSEKKTETNPTTQPPPPIRHTRAPGTGQKKQVCLASRKNRLDYNQWWYLEIIRRNKKKHLTRENASKGFRAQKKLKILITRTYAKKA